jgi:crossover junction endodeoxyribonuclease RuvC
MIIMGIDPSLTASGIIVLNDTKVIHQEVFKNKPNLPTIARVKDIYTQIIRLNLEFAPQLSVIEGLSFASKGQGTDAIFYLGWRIREELEQQNLPWIESSPAQVKKFATNKGTSQKQVMIKEVYKRWGFDTDDDNLADAYTMARIGLAYLGNTDGLVLFQKEVIAQLHGEKPAKKTRKKKVNRDGQNPV